MMTVSFQGCVRFARDCDIALATWEFERANRYFTRLRPPAVIRVDPSAPTGLGRAERRPAAQLHEPTGSSAARIDPLWGFSLQLPP
jgi:hypothetical protein